MRPHCFIPSEAFNVDLNWPISREKYLKIRLVCKNDIALAHYGSYRLLVKGVCLRPRPHVSGYFLTRNSFFPDSKISTSTRCVFKLNAPVYTHPMVSGFTVVPRGLLHLNVFIACAIKPATGKFALLLLLCRNIGLLFGKRLDTNLLRHRNRKYPDSSVGTLSDLLRSYFSCTLESGFKNIRIRVEGSRIWKENVAALQIKNIRIHVDGAI